MAGIIVQFIISWLLLWLLEKRNLLALGIAPTIERMKQSVIGFMIGFVFLSFFFVSTSWLVNNPFNVNDTYTIRDFLSSTWYVVKSVLYEELIFRGALLFILIRRVGAVKAILISAVCFGIYHWFSYSVFGQPMSMLVIFVGTGIVGYVLALAFHRTRALYLPIALHLGYNFTSMVIFSTDKGIGQQWLIKGGKVPEDLGFFISLMVTIVYFTGFPLLSYLYVRRLNLKNERTSLVFTK